MSSEAVKVLGLFPAFDSNQVGGVQESARIAWDAVAKHVEERGERTELFCYENKLSNKAADAHRRATITNSKSEAIVRAVSKRWRPEIIVIWHLSLLKILPFFHSQHARWILFLHGIESWRQQDWLTGYLLQRVDLFLSNSSYTWERFLNFYPHLAEASHQVVQLGMGSSVKISDTSAGASPAALMLGRLLRSEDYKGHQQVINAWPLVLKRIRNAELWIAGEGDLRSRLEKEVAALELQDKVRFWGYVSEDIKQELLRDCRCLALPSRGEGFGLVYLEAMRVGRPCLVSTLDAGREVVNPPDAGLAVNPADPEVLAGALCRLLADTAEWEGWSRKAICRYENNFTAQHFQGRLIAALFDDQMGTIRNV